MPRLLQSLLGLLSGFFSNRLRAPRHAPAGPPSHRESVPKGRKLPRKPPYDLAKDTSTDNQKYLM